MALTEICDSSYNHLPLYQFGKKYFKHRFKTKIICEECLSEYLEEVSNNLSNEIFSCLKNVDMLAMITTSDVYRTENFSFTFEKELDDTYMQYILPIKFDMNISFTYDKLKTYKDTDYLEMTSADSIYTKSPLLTSIRIARANIKPIVCDSTYPSFYISLDIHKSDKIEVIKNQIFEYMYSFVKSFFTQIPDVEVIKLMNDKNPSACNYASASACGPTCSKCNINVSSENYIYQNNMYCLDCMYGIVVQSAVDNNISTDIGLGVDVNNTSTYAVVNSAEYKRSVIDKYINVMKSLGANPNISHCMMVITG